MDPDGDPAPPANLHRRDSPRWRFHGKYQQWGLFPPFQKCKRTPLFSPNLCKCLQLHKKREAAVAAPLQANEGYLELEKLSASIPFPPRVIFYPWRGNDPEVLLYTWYVEVIVPGYLLLVINSAKCAENILKWYNKTENSSVRFIATDKYWLRCWLFEAFKPEQVNTDVSCSRLVQHKKSDVWVKTWCYTSVLTLLPSGLIQLWGNPTVTWPPLHKAEVKMSTLLLIQWVSSERLHRWGVCRDRCWARATTGVTDKRVKCQASCASLYFFLSACMHLFGR